MVLQFLLTNWNKGLINWFMAMKTLTYLKWLNLGDLKWCSVEKYTDMKKDVVNSSLKV